MALRWQKAELCPPDYHKDLQPVTLWVVHAFEENPPEGVKPLQWFLLTTLEITSSEQARECLRWYCLRWRIKDFYRTLKTGCRVQELRHKTAQRLKRAIAINTVIAWRIMLMALLGRESPEMLAEVLFTDIELEVMQACARQGNLDPPRKLHEAVNRMAKMGGYLNRTNDPPPGHQLLWQGYIYLRGLCSGYMLRGP